MQSSISILSGPPCKLTNVEGMQTLAAISRRRAKSVVLNWNPARIDSLYKKRVEITTFILPCEKACDAREMGEGEKEEVTREMTTSAPVIRERIRFYHRALRH